MKKTTELTTLTVNEAYLKVRVTKDAEKVIVSVNDVNSLLTIDEETSSFDIDADITLSPHYHTFHGKIVPADLMSTVQKEESFPYLAKLISAYVEYVDSEANINGEWQERHIREEMKLRAFNARRNLGLAIWRFALREGKVVSFKGSGRYSYTTKKLSNSEK